MHYNLMLKRQLDSGNMSRKQFTTLTQNLTNGTAQIVAITKKYNGYLQNQEKRMKEATDVGGQAAQDIWNAGKVQSFADFRDNAAFIDPTTMKVSQGKLVDKVVGGKTIRVMSENTGDFTQVRKLLLRANLQIFKIIFIKQLSNINLSPKATHRHLQTFHKIQKTFYQVHPPYTKERNVYIYSQHRIHENEERSFFHKWFP